MWIIIATALGGTLEEENAALRESIESFQKENKALRAESDNLRKAIDKKNESLEFKDEVIKGYMDLIDVKDRHISVLEHQINTAEDLHSILNKAYEQERKSKNVGKIERAFWISSIIAVGGIGIYGSTRNSSITVNTGSE